MPVVMKTLPLALESRQAAERDGSDVNFQAKAKLKLASDAFGVVQAVFDFDNKCVEAALLDRGGPELNHLRKGAEDLLHGAGKDVHAADDQHVVRPPQDAAFEQREMAIGARV